MIGIFGGSFDPIHHGHLRAALEAYQRLQLAEIHFVPCFKHAFTKSLQANASQRLQMVKLAIAGQPGFLVDNREIKQQQISYMSDTVKTMKQDNPQQKLALIIGVDAFLELPQWQHWQRLLNYTSIIVLHRPGYLIPNDSLINQYLAENHCKDKENFIEQKINSIFLLSIPMLEISSTYIRQQIKNKQNLQYLLPNTVNNYIIQEKIYQ